MDGAMAENGKVKMDDITSSDSTTYKNKWNSDLDFNEVFNRLSSKDLDSCSSRKVSNSDGTKEDKLPIFYKNEDSFDIRIKSHNIRLDQ